MEVVISELTLVSRTDKIFKVLLKGHREAPGRAGADSGVANCPGFPAHRTFSAKNRMSWANQDKLVTEVSR